MTCRLSLILIGAIVAVFLATDEALATGECITSCEGIDDGDYQSCIGCNVYASCSGGVIEDDRKCSTVFLLWDDVSKTCETISTTCGEQPDPPAVGECITSCIGIADGDYQSCSGCTVYVSCTGGEIIDDRDCAGTLVWDDEEKGCDWTSTTCPPAK